MMRRGMVRRGPGLVRTVATTAVIAGTAGAVHHRQEQKYAAQNAQQQAQMGADDEVAQLEQQVADLQAQQAQASIAPQSSGPDLTTQLNQLAQLKQSGILSDAEFEQAKRKLLGT